MNTSEDDHTAQGLNTAMNTNVSIQDAIREARE